MEKKYDIVIFGMNKYRDWRRNNNFNRSYYILNQLVDREEVDKILFIDFLPIRRQAALVDYFYILGRAFNRPLHLSPFSVLNEIKKNKLFNYASVASVINWKLVYRDIERALKKLAFNNIIIWSYDPLNIDYLELIKNKTTVFDLDVDWRTKKELQQGNTINYVDVLRKNYNYISDHADLIFTATDELMEVVMGHPRSYWLTDVNKQDLKDFDWKSITDEMFEYINQGINS